MIKINKYKSTKISKVLWVTIPLTIVAGLFVWYFVFKSSGITTPQPKYPIVEGKADRNTEDTQQTDTNNKEVKSNVPADTKTSQEVPAATTGAIVITEVEQSNGYVNAKAATSNFSSSQCVYSFVAPDSRPVVKEQPGNCSGISVSQNEFDKIGTYTLTVTAYGESGKLEAKKEIYIR